MLTFTFVEQHSQPSAPIEGPPSRRPLRKRLLLWVLLSLGGLIAVLAVLFTAAVPMSSDTLRHRIVRTLSDKLDSDIELGDLHLRVWPTMRAEGADLRIRRRGTAADIPPLIAIKSFHVDASILGVMFKHVDHVQLTGLTISIPPKPERRREKAIEKELDEKDRLRAKATAGTTAGDPQPADDHEQTREEKRNDPLKSGGVILDRVDTDDARLVIVPDRKDKEPKVWAIHHLTMYDMGAVKSWPFEATLTNGVPPGEIAVKGGFGPWDRNVPGDTPLNGKFDFENANLGVFKGISGTLSSKGSFEGTLDQIHTNGETDTPDLMINVGGHKFPLRTKYQALIDGTNGDTRLENIDATFLNTHLIAKGAVLDGPKEQHGRTVTLDVNMDKARIEDIMTMAVHTPKPPMTGPLRLTTKFVLPPGESDVSQRLRLDGRFNLARTKFTNFDVQAKIDELSKRARGKIEDPKSESVLSDFQGHFNLGEGRLVLPDLTFAIPGAKVELAGNYALRPETLEFKGQLLLDGMVSDTVKGWKKWIMRPADTIFKRPDGNGSAIPIKINGTRNDPKFGLDIRGVLKRRS